MPRFSVLVPAYKVQAGPRGTRAEFLRIVRAHYRRHRAPGAPVRPGARAGHVLVRLGGHRTRRLLSSASRTLCRARRLTATARRHLTSTALQLRYRTPRRLPPRVGRAVLAGRPGR